MISSNSDKRKMHARNATVYTYDHCVMYWFSVLQMEKGGPLCTRISRAIPNNKATPVRSHHLAHSSQMLMYIENYTDDKTWKLKSICFEILF